MECQSKVFGEAGLLNQLLRFRINGVCQNHQRHIGGLVFLMGLDAAHTCFQGQIQLFLRRCSLALSAAAPELGRGVTLLGRRPSGMGSSQLLTLTLDVG